MSKTTWKGSWTELKGKMKQTWGDLTDDDLMYEEGREEEMIGRIERRTGETKDNIRRKIDQWLS